jgi:hypothetical protein
MQRHEGAVHSQQKSQMTPHRSRIMAYHIKVGTTLLVKGSMLDDYVIEKITSKPTPNGKKVYTIEARTVRQRCFPRELTGYHTFDGAYILDCLKAGSMQIKD